MVKLSGQTWQEYKTFVKNRTASQMGEDHRRAYIEFFGQSKALQHLDYRAFWSVIDTLLDQDHGTAPFKWVEQFHADQATIQALENHFR